MVSDSKVSLKGILLSVICNWSDVRGGMELFVFYLGSWTQRRRPGIE